MGGLCFMVDDKMCVGTSINKADDQPQLVARIGESFYEEVLTHPGCRNQPYRKRNERFCVCRC